MKLRSSIIKLLSKYTNNELIRVSGKNSIQVVIKLITGLINIKLISVLLSSSGMAILSQYTNVIQFFTSMASGGINHGVTKLSASYNYSDNRVKLVVGNSFIIAISFSLTVSLVMFFFSTYISKTFLYSINYSGIVRASGFLVFTIVLNNIILALENGLQQNRRFIIINSYSAIIALFVIIPFVYLWEIHGAIYAQFLSGFIILCITIILTRKDLPRLKDIAFSYLLTRRLLNFGIMLLFASSLKPLTKVVSRNIIVNLSSLNEAGWWDGINKISTTYNSLIVTTLALYFLPKISKTISYKNVSKEIENSLLIVLPIVIFSSIIIYLLRDLIISILFTKEFLGMKELFFFQCLGDIVRIISWFFAITIMLKEKSKLYISIEIIIAVMTPLSVFVCVKYMGIEGSALAYFLNAIIYLLLMVTAYNIIAKSEYKNLI